MTNSNMLPLLTKYRAPLVFLGIAIILILMGEFRSWNYSFQVLNVCIISAIMALGVNIQWGYAGLLNIGVLGFVALGGLAAMLVSVPPEKGAWALSWFWLLSTVVLLIVGIASIIFAFRNLKPGKIKTWSIVALCIAVLFVVRMAFDPAVELIEKFEPHRAGFLGGLGLPIILSWVVGGFFAAFGAFLVGKIALGLRADYLAIATLGISEIIIAMIKNEDWLTRGVKNVSGLPRTVPKEVDLQQNETLTGVVEWVHSGKLAEAADEAARSDIMKQLMIESASLTVKLCYFALFMAVLIFVYFLAERALRSPWGRMMRAIRDNETAAEAMGKDVKGRHLQVFILGAFVLGISGAMWTTLNGQLIPTEYQPLRFTFMIWVMVIIGGSGNNLGAIVGGFILWIFFVEAATVGPQLMEYVTSFMADDSIIKQKLEENIAHMRYFAMGFALLLVMRFSPKGLIPERIAKGAD